MFHTGKRKAVKNAGYGQGRECLIKDYINRRFIYDEIVKQTVYGHGKHFHFSKHTFTDISRADTLCM